MLLVLLAACVPSPTPTSTPTPLPPVRVAAGYKANIPIAVLPTTLHRRCVEVWRGVSAADIAQIRELDVWCVRYGWAGESSGGMWQEYRTNGWTNLDISFKNDLAAIRSIPAIPIVVVHVNRHDGTCRPIPEADILAFATFVKQFAARYSVSNIDLGNEADASGGIPGLFGCHGKKGLYTDTWNAVRGALPNNVSLGMSFMLDNTTQHPFVSYVLARTAPSHVGVHSYSYYIPGSEPLTSYPGGLTGKLNYVKSLTNAPAWVTETNLIEYSTNCSSAFQKAQAKYIAALRTIEAPVVVYVLTGYSGSWLCAAINPDAPSWAEWAGAPYP